MIGNADIIRTLKSHRRVQFPAGLEILISTLGLEWGPLSVMRTIE